MTDGTVLVTGAFGLVGAALVRELAAQGRRVVATDLDMPANRKRAGVLAEAGDVTVRWADLTDAAQVDALVEAVDPAAIVHLAAVIPPLCYAKPAVAANVIVGATRSLVRAASRRPEPPRILLASSVAVYGSRNPHLHADLLTVDTAVRPADLYGTLKVKAEEVVTASELTWSILRLGGVLMTRPRTELGLDALRFEAVLPTDGRLQTVDVRDVAAAFAAATLTDATGEVFMIAGDDTHRNLQGSVGRSFMSALGLVDATPPGRPGDPESETDWFATDWVDTSRSQEVLSFQHHSYPAMLAEVEDNAGWRRVPLRLASPLMRAYLRRKSPYRGYPGEYADPWGAIRRIWGDPRPR